MLKKFLSNWAVRQILLALAALAALFVGIDILLGLYTRHGRELTVPDLTNMTEEEARYTGEKAGLKVEVTDSIYVRRMHKGVVYSQLPKNGSKVKKGRVIQLTINAKNAKIVTMPRLQGYSMRQAKSVLLSKGLTLGRLRYVNDIATNNVLKQLYKGAEIAEGTEIEGGSPIDLVLGLNPEDNKTIIPNVIGMKYIRAVDEINDNYLNIRSLVFDKSVKNYSDSLSARVYRQGPELQGTTSIMGSGVTLYLSLDKEIPDISNKQ